MTGGGAVDVPNSGTLTAKTAPSEVNGPKDGTLTAQPTPENQPQLPQQGFYHPFHECYEGGVGAGVEKGGADEVQGGIGTEFLV